MGFGNQTPTNTQHPVSSSNTGDSHYGGNLYVEGTLGITGSVGIGTSTFNASAAGVLTIANGTSPAALTANQIYIGSKDSTGLSSDGATLELFLEGAPEASGMSVPTMSHRISVWINGTEYFMYLDPV